MSCFAYWDIIPNSCLLLAQSPQEKASFPYSTLRVPRIFSAEGKTKIKRMMSTMTLCLKRKQFPVPELGMWIVATYTTKPIPKPFPLVSLCLRSTGLSVLRSSRVWQMAWGSVPWISLRATISQLVSPLGVPTPRSHPEEYRPSNLPGGPQIVGGRGGCSDTSWALPEHPEHFKVMPWTGRNKSQRSQRFLLPPVCCSFPWLLSSAPQTNPKNLFTHSRSQWLNPKLTYQKLSLLWLNCSKSRQGKNWNNPSFPSINHLHNHLSSSDARGRGMGDAMCHCSPKAGLLSG